MALTDSAAAAMAMEVDPGDGHGAADTLVVVRGAGTEGVNGTYKATAQTYCGAAVYEHAERGADVRLTREPHTNAKTGKTKHGWLLGCKGAPMYGAPTESLEVPRGGWKAFGGVAPVPDVVHYTSFAELQYAEADAEREKGGEAMESGLWQQAYDAFTAGIEKLKRCGEISGDVFETRAAAILGRRAVCCANLQQPRAALRDVAAALQLGAPATLEHVAVQAAEVLGVDDEHIPVLISAMTGCGGLLDPDSPLALRCIERWLPQVLEAVATGGSLPVPEHMPADRLLDGLDEEQCDALMRHYFPEEVKLGTTSILQTPEQCLAFMRKWDKVLTGDPFQNEKRSFWDRRDLSYPKRLQAMKHMVADALADVLKTAGFEPGLPGLARAVKEMQVHWSVDMACAQKAEDLEEMADVSLADLA